MKCSVTELKSLIYNSCLGLKFEVGICDEISEAVSCLESYNLSASEELTKCFQCKKSTINEIKTLNFTWLQKRFNILYIIIPMLQISTAVPCFYYLISSGAI